LSRGRTGASQAGQCDGGRTSDSPRGSRQIATLRNEPMARPSSPQAAATAMVITVVSSGVRGGDCSRHRRGRHSDSLLTPQGADTGLRKYGGGSVISLGS